MKQHVYAVQEMLKAAEKSAGNAKKERDRVGITDYQRHYHHGRQEAAEEIRDQLSHFVALDDLADEDSVKKLASGWRTKSLLLLQQAFKAEGMGRYMSRHILGMQYVYALAAIELERLLKGGVPQVAVA